MADRVPLDDTEGDAWARMEPMGDGAELLAMMSGDDRVITAAALRIRNDLDRYPADVHAFLGEIYVWLLSWTGPGPADDPGGEYADALLIARSYPGRHTPPDAPTEETETDER